MNIRRNLLAAGVIVAAFLAAAWFQFGGHRTPEGQPPLTDVNAASLDRFRADFNAAADQMRMILLLSPT